MTDLSLMIDDVKFNFRSGLMVSNGEEVLVECNPDFDFVTLPGGRVKTLESTIETLKREIKEEMGIILKDEEVYLTSVIENFFEFDNKKYHELYFLYRLDIKNDNRFKEDMKNMDSKNSYYKWVNKNKLKEVNLLPEVLVKIAKTDKFSHFINNDL